MTPSVTPSWERDSDIDGAELSVPVIARKGGSMNKSVIWWASRLVACGAFVVGSTLGNYTPLGKPVLLASGVVVLMSMLVALVESLVNRASR